MNDENPWWRSKAYWRSQWQRSTLYIDFSLQKDDQFRQSAATEPSVQQLIHLSTATHGNPDDQERRGAYNPFSGLHNPGHKDMKTWISKAAIYLEGLEVKNERQDGQQKPPSLWRRVACLIPFSLMLFVTSLLPIYVGVKLNERPYTIAMVSTMFRTDGMANLYFRVNFIRWEMCQKFLEERALGPFPPAIFTSFTLNPNLVQTRSKIWFRMLAGIISGLCLVVASFTMPISHKMKLRRIRKTTDPSKYTAQQLETLRRTREEIHDCIIWLAAQKQLSAPMMDYRSITISNLKPAEDALALVLPTSPRKDVSRDKISHTYPIACKLPIAVAGLMIDAMQLIVYRNDPAFFVNLIARGIWNLCKIVLLVRNPYVSPEATNILFATIYAGTLHTFMTLTIWYAIIGPKLVERIEVCAAICVMQILLKQTLSNHTAPVLVKLINLVVWVFRCVTTPCRACFQNRRMEKAKSDADGSRSSEAITPQPASKTGGVVVVDSR